MRAAMVGGAGYVAGKHMSESRQREEYQNQQLEDLQQAQAAQAYAPPPAAAPAAAPAGTDRIEALTKLKELLDAGVLSPDEFAAEKARILQGG